MTRTKATKVTKNTKNTTGRQDITRLVSKSTRGVLVVVILGVVIGVAPAAAQTSEPVGRVQAAVGVGWLGGASFGQQPADLRAASGGPYRLFESESDLSTAVFFEARAGVLLTPRFGVEGRAAIGQPELQTVVSSDAEATGSFTITETIDQYVFDGGVVFRFAGGTGLTPFASAGAGYVRQLHEGQALVETGHLFYVGGGFTYPLFSRAQGFIRAASVRADLRLNLFYMELDEGSRPQGSAAGSIVFTF
jgi:hypothetical protein